MGLQATRGEERPPGQGSGGQREGSVGPGGGGCQGGAGRREHLAGQGTGLCRDRMVGRDTEAVGDTGRGLGAEQSRPEGDGCRG